MSIDDTLQSHYNRKVADSEASNISKYTLAREYLDDAQKWNNISLFGVPFYSLIGLNNVFDIYTHKRSLNHLKRSSEDEPYLNFRAEMYKQNLKHNRSSYAFKGIAHVGIEALAIYNLCGESNQNSFLFWTPIIFGAASSFMYCVKMLQYTYIVNADPTSKNKQLIKDKLLELAGDSGTAINRPELS